MFSSDTGQKIQDLGRFSFQKSINVHHHFNRLKKKYHMIIKLLKKHLKNSTSIHEKKKKQLRKLGMFSN